MQRDTVTGVTCMGQASCAYDQHIYLSPHQRDKETEAQEPCSLSLLPPAAWAHTAAVSKIFPFSYLTDLSGFMA